MHTPTARLIAALSLSSLLLLPLAGCSTFQAPPSALEVTESATFDVAPKELAEAVRRALAEPPLSLESEATQDGVILTGYQSFPGDWHIARRWQERTRYRVAIIPDWNNPTGRARIEVTPETQQRPSGQHDWEQAPELNRPDRAKAVLAQIESSLRSAK